MTYGAWKPKRREPQTDSGIKRGYRIVVAVTRDVLTDVDAFPGADDLDGMLTPWNDEDQTSVAFRRAYVDEIKEHTQLILFTVCTGTKPYSRTRSKGEIRICDEGKTWTAGWGDDDLTALRAAFNLSEPSS